MRTTNLIIDGTREENDTKEDEVVDQEEYDRLRNEICRGYGTPSEDECESEEGHITYLGEFSDYPLSHDFFFVGSEVYFHQTKT